MTVDRRSFLRSSMATSLGFVGLGSLSARATSTDWVQRLAMEGYGPLIPDPAAIIDLPAHFSYQVISRAGEVMNDGFLVPGKHDGMAAFAGPEGRTVLVRNHEISPGHRCVGPFDGRSDLLRAVDPSLIYDAGAADAASPAPSRGGCTRVVFDTRSGQLVSHELALVGTEHNCAGGPTPMGSWLSCEESVSGPETDPQWRMPHGYVFEVPATPGSGLTTPRPITAMGRLNHEAVAVDSRTGIVYLTEDRNDGCIYRFIPNVRDRYLEGGRLEALAFIGDTQHDTRRWESPTLAVQHSVGTRWIPLDDVDRADDSLRHDAWERGAARFARGEGMWAGEGEIFFACTTGGRSMHGQIWRYTPADPGIEGSPRDGLAGHGQLKLIAEPNDATIVEHADNLTVSPWGDLIVCEDGLEDQFLLGVTPTGDFYTFGRNAMNRSEFAGATFAPDASTLFVNIQNPGLTLAIRGPWRSANT